MKNPFSSWERLQRFSIRKLSIGVVSATIGTALLAPVPLGQAAFAQEHRLQEVQQVQIDYHYVNYDDLTAQEQASLKPAKDLPQQLALSDAQYVLVYRQGKPATSLPKTGEFSKEVLALLGGLGLMGAVISLVRRDRKTLVKVVLLTGLGTASLNSSAISALDVALKSFLTTSHVVRQGDYLPAPKDLADATFYAYANRADLEALGAMAEQERSDSDQVDQASTATPQPSSVASATSPTATPQPNRVDSTTSPTAAPQPSSVDLVASPTAAPQPNTVASATNPTAVPQPSSVDSAASPTVAPQPNTVDSATSPTAAPQPNTVDSATSPTAVPQPSSADPVTSPTVAPQPNTVDSATSPTVTPQPSQPLETTSTESLPFTIEVISDESLAAGEEVLVQAGVEGVLTHTYLDGQLVSSQITSPAVNQIIRRGSQPATPVQPLETTSTESLPFTVEVISDDSLPLGEEVLVQAGVPGVLLHTYLDGQLVSSQVTSPAVNQIVRRGTLVEADSQPLETTSTESLPFAVEVISDDSLPLGEEVLVQAGVEGVLTHTYLDGKLVSSQVTSPAVNQIVRRGSKVVRQSFETTTTESIPFTTEVISDDSLPLGEEILVQAGVLGVLTHTYRDEQLISSQITSSAINQVVRRGTKVVTPAQPLETTGTEVIPFETEVIVDDNLPLGEEVVVQVGVEGVLTHTYHNGQLVSSRVTSSAINQIIRRGTKVVTPVQPLETTSTEVVPFDIEIVFDEVLPVGEELIDRPGVDGVLTHTYVNGQLVSSEMTTPVINQVVRQGTKVVTTIQPVVGGETVRQEVILLYENRTEEDAQLWLGERQLVQRGKTGRKEILTTYRTLDGVRQPEPEVTERVLEPAQDEIVRIGTKPIDGQVDVETVEPVAPRTETRVDPDAWYGEVTVEEAGQAGENKVITTYKTVRGVRTNEVLDSRVETLRPAVNRIEVVGNKPLEGELVETSEEVISFTTTYRPNPDLPEGETRTITEGRNGLTVIKKTYRTIRGEKVGDPVISREERVAVQHAVIEQGSQVIPAQPVVGRVTDRREEVVTPGRREEEDDQLWAGDRQLVQPGRPGRKEILTTYRTLDGVRQPDPEVTERILEPAQDEIVRIGTKPIEGQVDVETVEPVAPRTETRVDPDAWYGEVTVEEVGQPGENKVITTYKTVRGVRTNEVLDSRVETLRPAVNRIEVVGNKPLEGELVETSEEVISFTTTYRPNPDLPEGETRTVVEGRNGLTIIKKTYRTIRGEKVGDPVISREERVAVQNAVIEQGSQVTPAQPVVGTVTDRREEVVPPSRREEEDDQLWAGDRQLVQPGRPGRKEILTTYRTLDGVRQSDPEVTERILEPAQDEIVRIGTKPIDGQVDVETVEPVAPRTETRVDPDAWFGDVVVEEAGQPGENKVITTYKTVRGVRTNEVLDSRVETLRPAINRVEVVGNKPLEGELVETSEEVITFTTTYRPNPDLPEGETRTVVEGRNGLTVIKKTYRTVRGEKVGDPVISREERVAVQNAVIEQGTKVAPAQPVVGRVTDRREEVVTYGRREEEDDQLWAGDRQVVQSGRPGRKEILTTYRTLDGVRQPDPEVTERVLEPAQDEIVRIGTKPIDGQVDVETVEPVAPRTETRVDPDAWFGEVTVEEAGQPGENKVITTYKTVRGVRTNEVLDSRVETLRPAVNRIEVVGNKPLEGELVETSEEVITFTTTYRPNPDLPEGETRTVVEGRNGLTVIKKTYRTIRGEKVGDPVISREERVAVQNAVIEQGTGPELQPTVSIDDITLDNTINASESQRPLEVTGHLVNGRAGDRVVIRLGDSDHNAEVTGDRFTVQLSGQDLIAHRSLVAKLLRDGAVRHQSTHAYDVVTSLDNPVITINDVTNDNIVNLEESKNGIVISGLVNKANEGEEITISCGCSTCQGVVEWVDVTTRVEGGRFNVTLPGNVVAGGTVIKATVTTTDPYGNTATGRAEKTYEVDVTPPDPSLTFNAITSNNIINQASPDRLTISGNIINLQEGERVFLTATIGETLHHVEVNGRAYALNLPKTAFEQGEAVRLSLSVTDRAGNKTTLTDQVQTYTYDVSLAAPAITLNQVPTVTSQTRQVVLSGGLSHEEDVARASVRVIYNGQSRDARLTDGRWEVSLPADQVTHTQGAQSYRVEAEVTDRAGNSARHEVTGTFTVASSLPVVTLSLNELPPVEPTGSETVLVTGRVSGHRAGDRVTTSLNGQSLSADIRPDGQFDFALKRADLVTNASRRLDFAIGTTDEHGNVGQDQKSLTYTVASPTVTEELTINLITADDHINVTEASKSHLTISGQARGASSVQLTIGETIVDVAVTDGRYSHQVATQDLVTNASYKITARSGDKTQVRTYTVAPEATNTISLTAIGDDFALNPASDTVRISGSLRLEGLAAKHHNDLFVDTVLVTLKDKTYTVGLGKTRVSREKIRGWWEDVKTKDFHVDIPLAELKAAQGETLRFALPKDHHVLYDARGSYGDSVQDISTAYQALDDQTKYTLKDSPWLENRTGKTIVLPPEDKTTISGRVGGNAREGNEVEIRIGDQVYRGQVDSDKQFAISVDRSALQDGGAKVITATLKGKDYAQADIVVSDSLLYNGQQVTTKMDFVTTFDTAKSSEEEVPYFIKAIRDELYNSTGHLARQPIGQENYTLTYHFINDGVAISFNQEQRDMMKKIFDEIASHTKITFVEKETIGPGNTADINLFILRAGGRSHAYMGGSVYFTALPVSEASYKHTYATALHEVLHSLGAEHPHEGTPPLTNEDGLLTSVMTYNLKQAPARFPLRVLDQMYLHYRYGVNPNQHKEDNTYTFKRQTSYSLEDSNYIWDGAGLDTFDASMEDKPVTVDLTPGSWIHRGDKTTNFWADETKIFHKKSGDFFRNPYGQYDDTTIPNAMVYNDDQAFIGYGTQIERLIGSKHDDVLRGNVADNDILGGAGADKIWGDAGDDYIDGGAGADQMDGGAGNDTYIVDNERDTVTEGTDPGRDHIIASVDYDLPDNVEDLTMTGRAELGYGNSGANRITGNSQANTLRGRGGADTFVFNSPLNGNVDVIEDFDDDDIIELSAAVFAGVDSTRPFERIRYDRTSGELAYLPNVAGQLDPITFAKLTPGYNLRENQVRVQGQGSQTPPPPSTLTPERPDKPTPPSNPVTEELILDAITADDHINVTEAGKSHLTISGQAKGASSVQLTIGETVVDVAVTDGRYSHQVATKDLVTNPTYQVIARSGGKTQIRTYSVAPWATAQLVVTGLGEVEQGDTVRVTGRIELDGLAAKYGNPDQLHEISLTINDKTYQAGVDRDRRFSFALPLSELEKAKGQTISFGQKGDSIYRLEARYGRNNYRLADDVVAEDLPELTSRQVIFDQTDIFRDGRVVDQLPSKQTVLTGRVTGAAQVNDEVTVKVGHQLFTGRIGEDKTFIISLPSAVVKANQTGLVEVRLTTKDYAGQPINLTDVVVTDRQTLLANLVTTFEHSKIDKPYFLAALSGNVPVTYRYLPEKSFKYTETPVITYRFFGPEQEYRLDTINQHNRDATRRMMDLFSKYANIKFEEVSADQPANITYRLHNNTAKNNAWFGGDVNFGGRNGQGQSVHTDWSTEEFRSLFIHETLHSFGAKHAHEGNPVLPELEDQSSLSLMTYRPERMKLHDFDLKLYDLIYLHYRFGVNPDQRSENNSYSFQDFDRHRADGNVYVWDGGGIDTFDASHETESVTIDLTPGSWIYRGRQSDRFVIKSSTPQTMSDFFAEEPSYQPNNTVGFGYFTGTYTHDFEKGQAFIGYGTQIERLIGSSQADVLRGNVANNEIFGGAGDDKIWGDAGDDYIDGGAGADQMDGGLGNDTFIVDNVGDTVTEGTDPGRDHVIASVNFDLPENVEDLTLTGTAQTGQGNSGDNRITGNAAANTLRGNGGADTFVFNSPLNGAIDVIEDFGDDDIIELSANIFTGIDSSNPFGRISYDRTSGELSYLPDVVGQLDPITFAKLPAGLNLRPDQIVVR